MAISSGSEASRWWWWWWWWSEQLASSAVIYYAFLCGLCAQPVSPTCPCYWKSLGVMSNEDVGMPNVPCRRNRGVFFPLPCRTGEVNICLPASWNLSLLLSFSPRSPGTITRRRAAALATCWTRAQFSLTGGEQSMRPTGKYGHKYL